MDIPEEYININKASWNDRVPAHLASDFYDMPGFLAGKQSLNDIELGLLGDLKDKKVLHLQCHFGQDSISLARMGAIVTGVDLSDKAIAAAEELSQQTAVPVRFICCDIYDLPQHLEAQFDLVFTSYGTIGWLPDLDKWASLIHRYLKPGGRFVFAEFHPVVWMFDDDFTKIAYDYFNYQAIVETYNGTYAEPSADLQLSTVCWNHGLGEVLSSLLQQGLLLESFQEFDYSPYPCFNNVVAIAPGKYRIAHLEKTIPMVYALSAQKSQ